MLDSPIDVHSFEDIRPYYHDHEIQAAIARLVQEPLLIKMMRWVYPGLRKAEILEMFQAIQNIEQFQEEISAPAIKVITQMTTSGLTFSNVENLQQDQAHLFISNHRDIILDSALLNVSLLERGFATTEIAIGDNLLKAPLVRDLVRCNRNFIVNRDVSAKEVYHYSLRLSNYIRSTVTERNTSIWIAQREGRSKDGDDRTATGLLKMFAMSSDKQMEESLSALRITPMCVSYEYDPCDFLKTHELLHHKYFGSYQKQPGEDVHSMLTGLTGHKGRVNVAMGQLMNDRILALSAITNKNEKFKALGEAIDAEMHRIYKLWPTNYIAYDLLHGTKEYKEHYSNIQRIAFVNYIRGHVLKMALGRKKTGLPSENLNSNTREILLQMYANPVINRREIDQQTMTLEHEQSARD
ncbi:MAG: 1-acyl-sn-glycerol-3-phosphate acyltransferase [Flavobacteriales bacterium]